MKGIGAHLRPVGSAPPHSCRNARAHEVRSTVTRVPSIRPVCWLFQGMLPVTELSPQNDEQQPPPSTPFLHAGKYTHTHTDKHQKKKTPTFCDCCDHWTREFVMENQSNLQLWCGHKKIWRHILMRSASRPMERKVNGTRIENRRQT